MTDSTDDSQSFPAILDPSLPHELAAIGAQRWEMYVEAACGRGRAPRQSAAIQRVLTRVWSYSEFIARSCIEDPGLLEELLDSGDLLIELPTAAYARRIRAALEDVTDDTGLAKELRTFRRREMVRIAWRDLAGWADLDETLTELSALAEACLEAAVERLHEWQSKELGRPVGVDTGAALSLIVLAMGKLGARELNFSSDVDLIFAFSEEGNTQGGIGGLTNEEYFTRLAGRLVRIMSELTEGGFVFRVDTRLRPFGDSGPLVMSFDAMEEYYQAFGREWERYALIKARPVAGDLGAGAELLERLRPFVYRRYIDFGVFAALREMKELIAKEVARKGVEHNIKLGAGGIREIEFIGQAFQLVRGGRQPILQERAIQPVLRLLGQSRLMPDYVVAELLDAYRFLRRMENRLQEHDDQQTHQIPSDELGRLRLAQSMGFADWAVCEKVLRRHRVKVRNHFDQLFLAPQTEKEDGAAAAMAHVWQRAVSGAEAARLLVEAGFDDAHEVARLIEEYKTSSAYRGLSVLAQRLIDTLMPLLLGAVAGSQRPALTFKRVFDLVEAVAGRTAYLTLLNENPLALSQLVKLCGASPWISRLVTEHPVLLDDLLDPRSLYAPLDKAALAEELRLMIQHVAWEDLEQQLEKLSYFKQRNTLRVAAADVMNVLPLMQVSDHLTYIAEVILGHVLWVARMHLEQRHGRARCVVDGQSREADFAIIGYGKLGGIELGYGSDLDIVFLHDSAGEQQYTDGPKPIENGVFYARLGQRIIHLLNTYTAAGVLYEIDVRLRPSGAAGLLVSSAEAFAAYQRTEAWTWEHQALVRARVVAGGTRITRMFEAVRAEVLGRKRDLAALRREVVEMRERMRVELGSREAGYFDLKQDPGGIADIEFMVQYSVLAAAHDYPQLLRWTDNIRLLEGLAEAGLMSADDAAFLCDAYRALRARVHHLSLQDAPARVGEGELDEYRAGVTRLWEALMAVGGAP